MQGSGEPLTMAMVADIPEDGINAFQDYEALVLPMLEQHGGRLERRLRTADRRTEVHILSFDTRTSFDSYMADPDRMAHRALLASVDVEQRLHEVHDVRGG